MKSFAIIPAAGTSQRMGQPKLMLPWQGHQLLIDAVLECWLASSVDHVVVTVHPENESLQRQCLRHDVQVLVPETPPEDMKRSILFGLNFIGRSYHPQPVDALLLAPADMPRLSPPLIDLLISNHDPTQPRLLAPQVAGRRGHPLLLPWPASSEIGQLDENQGVNALWDRLPAALLPSDQDGALVDIDTPGDYEQHRPSSG